MYCTKYYTDDNYIGLYCLNCFLKNNYTNVHGEIQINLSTKTLTDDTRSLYCGENCSLCFEKMLYTKDYIENQLSKLNIEHVLDYSVSTHGKLY